MKRLTFIAAACLLAAACTPQDGGGETASLEVSPKSLTFGAEDTTPQEITVTATGVEWEYAVPSSADWITVDDGTAGKLLVSVTKNPTEPEEIQQEGFYTESQMWGSRGGNGFGSSGSK